MYFLATPNLINTCHLLSKDKMIPGEDSRQMCCLGTPTQISSDLQGLCDGACRLWSSPFSIICDLCRLPLRCRPLVNELSQAYSFAFEYLQFLSFSCINVAHSEAPCTSETTWESPEQARSQPGKPQVAAAWMASPCGAPPAKELS